MQMLIICYWYSDRTIPIIATMEAEGRDMVRRERAKHKLLGACKYVPLIEDPCCTGV